MISFGRSYPVDLKSSTGRIFPAQLHLAVTCPETAIDPQSGMIANLVDIDAAAVALLKNFEFQAFRNIEEAMTSLLAPWQKACKTLNVQPGATVLRGPFGEFRAEAGQRYWVLRAFAFDTSTSQSGFVFVSARKRTQAVKVLKELKALQSFDLLSLQKFADHTRLGGHGDFSPPGLIDLGFRLRKTGSQIRLRL